MKQHTKWMKRTLVVIHGFIALSAAAGGYYILSSGGIGMPLAWLASAPFHEYLIPGLILFFVVGGTNVIACLLLIRNNKYARESSAIGGFGQLIWIYTEIYLIHQSHWLQTLYFSLAVAILILIMLLLKYERKTI